MAIALVGSASLPGSSRLGAAQRTQRFSRAAGFSGFIGTFVGVIQEPDSLWHP